jgi:dipeptidase E
MAKLVLYSDQEIPANHKVDQRLQALIGKSHPNIGYIPSASDSEQFWYTQKRTYYAALGMDLSVYFEVDIDYRPERLPQLFACDAIHLSGGNTYHFLYWLRSRGMLSRLSEYVAGGGILIGVSAGSILITPEISSTSFCNDFPLSSEAMTDLSALGLVDFAFLPHLNQITNAVLLMQKYSLQHNQAIYGCQDGDGIVIDGNKLEFIGKIQKAENGKLESVITTADQV